MHFHVYLSVPAHSRRPGFTGYLPDFLKYLVETKVFDFRFEEVF
jgi:hypothetical protein